MITLAVAYSFRDTGVVKRRSWTGGEDVLNFSVPEVLSPSYQLIESQVFGVSVDGRINTYYLGFFCATVALFLAMLRVVNSPFGRVLQAIRENDFRAEEIGYSTVVYRTMANVLAALFATMAGVLLALWLRYNSAESSLSFDIMINILLIVVIGGMGTLYGAICGTVSTILPQNYLEDLMAHTAGKQCRTGRWWLAFFRPTGGCCGWECCLSCRFISCRLALWGNCCRLEISPLKSAIYRR